MSTSNPFGMITTAEAMGNFAANMSAMSCPTTHRNAVAVEDLEGETVAALCPDCDRQLPVAWVAKTEGTA